MSAFGSTLPSNPRGISVASLAPDPEQRFIVGVDLGQAQDFTAIVVLEKTMKESDRTRERDGQLVPVQKASYAVRHIDRLALGTPYPEQVQSVRSIVDHLGESARIVVDQTGVGRPVVDMLRSHLRVAAVTITGGDKASRDGMDHRVPKRDLVSTVQVLLQSKRLAIASGLRHAQTLVDELLAFKVRITAGGHDKYGNDVGVWRENAHDDLILATALGCWLGEDRRNRAGTWGR
jgi:hypothetical protein